MKKSIVYTAITKRTVMLFIVAMIILLGLYSYRTLPKQEYPNVSAPGALITVVYPGASSEDIEKLVTSKIEEKVMELKGYDYCYSFSQNSLSATLLVLDMDLSKEEINNNWNDLQRKLEDLKSDLPDGIQDIDINTDLGETTGLIVSISGSQYSYEQLESYAESFKKELLKVQGMKKVELLGKQEKEVKVEIKMEKLNHFNIALEDVVKILGVQNIKIPSGPIENNDFRLNVSVDGMYSSLEEIKNTIVYISGKTGAVIRLKDIARIHMELEDTKYKIKQDGNSAVLLVGYFKDDQNIVDTGNKVRKKIDQLKEKVPPNLMIKEIVYQPKEVAKSVNDFIINLIEGVIIVIAVVMVGMGLRNSAVVSLAIPLSILITFSVMNLAGYRVHMITITGLIMALGMLVDNAIVVSDAIQVQIDKCKDKLTACVNGAKEVSIPVLCSTLTTIAAFTPLLFLPKAVGQFAGGIPRVIIISLISSYFVAMLVIPVMAYLFFKQSNKALRQSFIRKLFERLLNFGLHRKKTTLIVGIFLLIISLAVGTLLPMQLYPKSQKKAIYIDVKTEYASDISKTEAIVEQIEEVLEKQDAVTSYTASIGGGLPKFDFSIIPQADTPDLAQILVKVDLKRSRFVKNAELVQHLQKIIDKNIVGADVTVKQLDIVPTGDAPIQVRIAGESMKEMRDASEYIKKVLATIKGTVNIDDDIESRSYEFLVDVDEDAATAFGITKYTVQNEVNIALMGRKASVFRNQGKEYGILVNSNIESKEQLENLVIKSPITGNKVLLKQIAKIRLIPQLPIIKRYNGERSVSVTSEVAPGYNAVDIQTELQQRLATKNFEQVNVTFEGEKAELENDLGNIGIAAIFAVFAIFIILMVQFNSVVQPFVVMVSIPFSAIGSIFALLTLNQPLSIFGVLGIVSLIGVVVNNAIILIDFINSERKKGRSINESCKKAVSKRFRPVVLTTATTVMGLIPLAFSGNDLFVPMSISFMGGLLISTLLTLVMVPVIYSLVEGKLKFFRTRKVSINEEC